MPPAGKSYGVSKAHWKAGAALAAAAAADAAALAASSTSAPAFAPVTNIVIAAAPTTQGAPPAGKSYGISKAYWKTPVVVQTNSEAASTTPNPTPAKRFYGVSKPYWKQDTSAPLLDTKVTLKVLLSSRSTLEEKEAVFKPFRELRESNNAVYEKVVQEMLAMLDNVGDNFQKVRLPIPPSFGPRQPWPSNGIHSQW